MHWCSGGGTVHAEEVKLDANNFPDQALRTALENATGYYDDDDDYYSSSAVIEKEDGKYIETNNITYLYVTGLKNFTGIDRLTNLQELSLNDCTNGTITLNNGNLSYLNMYGKTAKKITVKATGITSFYMYNSSAATSLDISKSTKLKYLDVYKNNKLTSITAPKSVTSIDCYKNKLSKLNLSKLTNLQYLYCGDNKFKTLDLSKNKKLTYLYAYGNKLTSVNVKKCGKLYSLNLEDNKKLKSVDVSKNKKLEYLYLSNTAVSSLNLKKNTKLYRLDIRGTKIKSINLSKNKKLGSIYMSSKIKKMNLKKFKNAYIYFEVKRGKSVNLNNYLGKGYTVEYAESAVTYNKKKGTAKLAKNTTKGEYYYLTLKKGSAYYYIRLIAK